MASVTGFIPGLLMSVYFATKHYVLAFSEALIEELRGSGVEVAPMFWSDSAATSSSGPVVPPSIPWSARKPRTANAHL